MSVLTLANLVKVRNIISIFQSILNCLEITAPNTGYPMNLQVSLAPYIAQAGPVGDFHSSIKRITVPHDKTGLLIGKRGRNLVLLQDKSGARVHITEGVQADPRSGLSKEVDIIGTPQQIRKAEQLINNMLLEDYQVTCIKSISNSLIGRSPMHETEGFRLADGFKVKIEYYDLYKAIKTAHGDIRRPSILDASEMAVVWIVSDLLAIVNVMCQMSLLNMTEEVLDDWDKKICLAEHFDYNVAWIRDHFEELRKEFKRKECLDAEVSGDLSYSKDKKKSLGSVEEMISLLTSHLKSVQKTMSELQSQDEEECYAEIVEEEDSTVLRVRGAGPITSAFRRLGCFFTSKWCLFCVLLFVMFIMFSEESTD
ncbi:hypothetical protein ACHQM5_015520 [Ranunculus cassubicifolius]